MSNAGLMKYKHFRRDVELRVGTITDCAVHPQADRLYVLRVNLGDGDERTICAGLRETHEISDLMFKQVVVMTNVKMENMRGIRSEGALLVASDRSGMQLVSPQKQVKNGSVVS